MALWRPRFERAARWFLRYEADQRARIAAALVEQQAKLDIEGPAGTFTLSGRADRIDLFGDGAAAIIDYKTGRAPSQKQIKALLAPQLPLEGAMLMSGAFPGLAANRIADLVHIRLTGGETAGEECPFDGDATGISWEALTKLKQVIARYDDPGYPYVSRVMVERTIFVGEFDHLARIGEWSLFAREEE
jgi:ATP-dependent helicase/nuclease subunit B